MGPDSAHGLFAWRFAPAGGGARLPATLQRQKNQLFAVPADLGNVMELQQSGTFRCGMPESPKNAAFASRFNLLGSLLDVVNFPTERAIGAIESGYPCCRAWSLLGTAALRGGGSEKGLDK